MNPDHVFEREGIYIVTLTVSDGQYTNTDSMVVIISESEDEGPSVGEILVSLLVIIFIIIFMLIIAFIRKMKYRFL